MTTETDQQSSHPVANNLVLTHGTAEVRVLEPSREFFEDVLGLRVVRHSPVSQLVAGCFEFGIVNLGSGDRLDPQGAQNRWVLSVGDADAVAEAHRKANESDFPLSVSDISEDDGVSRFRLQDGDSNWWEVTNLSPTHYDHYFKKGDTA